MIINNNWGGWTIKIIFPPATEETRCWYVGFMAAYVRWLLQEKFIRLRFKVFDTVSMVFKSIWIYTGQYVVHSVFTSISIIRRLAF